MAWLTFATFTSPTAMSTLDTQFANVATFGTVPCTATGTNVITLTPVLSGYTGPAYANYVQYSFVAANTSSGTVTLKVGALAALNVYRSNGTTQITSNDIVAGRYYTVAYNSALNSSAGGWVLGTGGSGFDSPNIVITNNNSSTSAVAATLEIIPPTSTINTGLYVYQNALAGTATGSYNPYLNQIYITETINNPYSTTTGFAVFHNFGSSSAKGGRTAIAGYATLTSATNSANTARLYIGVLGTAHAFADDGGTNLTSGAKGAIYGLSGIGQASNGAVYLNNVTGCELNTYCATGSSVRYKSILQLSAYDLDAVAGGTVNAMIWAYNQALTASSALWDDGILFDGTNAQWPIKSGGYILRTQGGPFGFSLKDNGTMTLSSPTTMLPAYVSENMTNDSNASIFFFEKYRTGAANNGAVQTNDLLGSMAYYGKDQSGNYQSGGSHVVQVTAVGASSVTAKHLFYSGATLALTITGTSVTPAALLLTTASATGTAGLRIPSGTAPTSPVSGDMWYDGTNLKFRDGSTTRTITWT